MESQESFERLKQSQEDDKAREEQLLSISNHNSNNDTTTGGGDVHLDMAVLDKNMQREAQQIAKLEEELERLIQQQSSQ